MEIFVDESSIRGCSFKRGVIYALSDYFDYWDFGGPTIINDHLCWTPRSDKARIFKLPDEFVQERVRYKYTNEPRSFSFHLPDGLIELKKEDD